MSATAKFYTGLALALALIVAVSYYAGYRSGFHAAATAVRSRAATHVRATP